MPWCGVLSLFLGAEECQMMVFRLVPGWSFRMGRSSAAIWSPVMLLLRIARLMMGWISLRAAWKVVLPWVCLVLNLNSNEGEVRYARC